MLNYEYPPLGGGAAPVAKFLAEHLVELGHSVDVVTMGYKGLKKEEAINGVNIYRVPSIRKELSVCQSHEMLSYCISAYRFIPKLLNNNYDINHTHFIVPTGLISCLNRRKIPYVITTHGSDVPNYNPDRFGFQHKLIKPVWSKVVNGAACIVSPSHHLKNLIAEETDYKNIQVIPNGMNSDRFSPKDKEDKVLVVSRLFERKGIQYVIEAMKEIDEYELNICGNGPYKDTLKNMIENLGVGDKVHLLGYVSEERLKHEFETSSIFVLPSSSENFPVVLQEAMCAGCAIITTNTTGCPEVVGDAAMLVPPKSSEDIKCCLMKLIDDSRLRKNLGHKARERVSQKFSWRSIAKRYERCYEEAIDTFR